MAVVFATGRLAGNAVFASSDAGGSSPVNIVGILNATEGPDTADFMGTIVVVEKWTRIPRQASVWTDL